VYPWLLEGAQDLGAEQAEKVLTEHGEVYSVDLPEQKRKVYYGGLSAIMRTRTVTDVMLLEIMPPTGTRENAVDQPQCAAISMACKQAANGLRLIVYGAEAAIADAKQYPLAKLETGAGCLGGFRRKELVVHLHREDSLGKRETGYSFATRRALLYSPKPMKVTPPFITCMTDWSPAMVAFLVSCADLPGASLVHRWQKGKQCMPVHPVLLSRNCSLSGAHRRGRGHCAETHWKSTPSPFLFVKGGCGR
jgi:hypothetical protein